MEFLKRDEWTWSRFNDLLLQEFQALIIDYKRGSVLVKRDEARWIMPAHVGDQDNYESSFLPEFVKEKILDEVELKMDLCVLRQLWRDEMPVKKDKVNYTLEKAVVLVQCLFMKEECSTSERDDTRRGHGKEYVWLPLADADIYHLIPDARKVIAEEIEWAMQGRLPENRLKWQRPGWMESIMIWMNDALVSNLGAQVIEPIYVERTTPLGTIIISVTKKGKFFLKCTPPWQNDAAYTEALARMAPKYVAVPIAVDVGNQVMITRDYGEILVPAIFDHTDQMNMTLDFVKLQQKVVGNVDELVRVGVPDFRLDPLLKQMDRITSHPALEAINERMEYQEATDFFRSNLDKLKVKVKQLHTSGLPPTMTHNDLILSNVYRKEGLGNFMFFDWVEGYVAHPLTGNLDGLEKNVYLSEWEKYANVQDLRKWCLLGRKVRILIECIINILKVEKVEKADRGKTLAEAGEGIKDVQQSFAGKV